MDNTQVKTAVRDTYADIARKTLMGAQANCCDPQAACCSSDYAIPANTLAELRDASALPAEVVSSSLGCGTPLEIAQLRAGEVVLDLGSGGGLDCFYASKFVGPTGRVIGVDMTPEMIALAEANREKVGATNVEFRLGELEHLPLEDDSVDVIISNCVINLSPDKDATFREAYRVLKPGGRVAVSDILARFPLPGFSQSNPTSWAACVSGAITEQEYLAKMRAAGLADVEKVSGGENRVEPVYSAKIVARKSA